MTDEKPPPSSKGTTWSALGVAAVGAVVGSVTAKVLDLPMQAVVSIALIVAVAFFLGLSLAWKRLRNAIYVRPFRWLFGLRITTRRQREVMRAEGEKTRSDVVDALAARETFNGHLSRMSAVVSQHQATADMQSKRIGELTAERDALQNQLDEVQPPNPLPKPAPRWKLEGPAQSGFDLYRFRLRNLMPGSVVLNARMDSNYQGEGFRFEDAAFWDDLSGIAEGQFAGRFYWTDTNGDIQLKLTWLDEDHEENQAQFSVHDPDWVPNAPF